VQNKDGGFGAAKGRSSNQLITGWAGLGVASARRNPRDVARRGGRAITTYLRRGGSLSDTGDLERTILLLKASGLSPRRFGGRDLVAELVRRRRCDGSWKNNVALTSFGLLALRAAGAKPGDFSIRRAASFVAAGQNPDGGFGFAAGVESDVDDTGSVLQSLAAAGRRRSATARRAVAYLRAQQNPDGGFGQMKGRSSNTQSTAWAVQGLVAAGVRPESVGANPLRYIARLQRRDGHVAYSRTSNQTPIWVTAQALTALRKKTFPLAAVPRRKHRHRKAASAGAGAATASGTGGAKAAGGAKKKEAPAGAPQPGGPGTAGIPTRQDPRPQTPQADTARASGRDDGNDPVSPWLYGAGAAGALALVWLVRRRLRARRLLPG
jgi:squalene-hopene cyclase-like protein